MHIHINTHTKLQSQITEDLVEPIDLDLFGPTTNLELLLKMQKFSTLSNF